MQAILEINDAFKSFGPVGVMSGVDLEVRPGERHALIGPNGAGKSTLFNLITGKYALDRGRVFFKGRRIDRLSVPAITRLGIARSFQITNIFADLSVMANVRFSVAAHRKSALRVFAFLSRLGAVTRESETLLRDIGLWEARDETAGTLAYGQQRALELGLTLALQPELMLLDEPTAGMTPEETRAVVNLIRRITQDRTLLIIEHDLDVVFGLADRISVLHNGRIIATDTPEGIKQNQAVKDAYLGNLMARSGEGC
jgi:branched-chain amino acid transport system ATP-binding protein